MFTLYNECPTSTDLGKINLPTKPCKLFVPPGEQAMFTAAAQYQWTMIEGCPLNGDDRKDGTQSPTFTIFQARKEDEGKYFCKITGKDYSVLSSEVQLIVGKLSIHCTFYRLYINICYIAYLIKSILFTVKFPRITKQPCDFKVKYKLGVPVNDRFNFSVEATGDDLGYEWKRIPEENWPKDVVYTKKILSISATDIPGPAKFQCIVSNTFGEVKSNIAELIRCKFCFTGYTNQLRSIYILEVEEFSSII